MKKCKSFMIILVILSFVVLGVSFGFLDNIIPIHFGIDGNVDSYGSKFLLLIIPSFMALICISMLLVCKYAKVSDNYRKYLLLTGVIIECIFISILGVVLFATFKMSEGGKIDISKPLMMIFGLLFIVIGNFMPKIEKNSTLGLKTKWSMYNKTTWQKSHRFCGFVGVIIGFLTIIFGLFFKEMVNFIILMSLIFVFMISSMIASYIYYKEEISKGN